MKKRKDSNEISSDSFFHSKFVPFIKNNNSFDCCSMLSKKVEGYKELALKTFLDRLTSNS